MEISVPSPVGPLRLIATATGLSELHFAARRAAVPGVEGERTDGRAETILERVRTELDEYFAGGRVSFDIPLHLHGTPFQIRVWTALREIPYGTTLSYGELARRIGAPKAVRAVGAANGQNPVAIIVPCHRVIGANGDLTGFGGGIERKRWLLQHESASQELALGI
jgi:methylated-DNA-[protein]-cysteine S-methyltransferase